MEAARYGNVRDGKKDRLTRIACPAASCAEGLINRIRFPGIGLTTPLVFTL
jgi:hypothetical protein